MSRSYTTITCHYKKLFCFCDLCQLPTVCRPSKMGRKYMILFALVAMGLCVAADDEVFHYLGHEFDKTPLGDAIDKASIKMLTEAYQSSEEKNLIASPLGVFTLLSLYSAGAPGPVSEEVVAALGASNYTELFNSYSSLSARFADMDASYLTLANKIYVSNKYTLAEEFEATASRSFRSEVEAISFEDATAAATTINHWAETKTQGHIKNPMPEDAIDPTVVAALLNVIFFQGHWGVPFNASETKEEDFRVSSDVTVKKPMMHLLSSLFYYESKTLDAKLVELPYKETGFRMVVVLPNAADGLPELLKKVEQHGLLSDVFQLEPAGVEIDVRMPKFDIESELDLTTLLPKMGISKLFSDAASGIVKGDSVVVSKAFHKAFARIDEEGATAGAFTGFIAVPLSSNYKSPPPMPFHADHPFLFIIMYQDKTLFIGTYTH